ncbi:MAG: hypothetical protein AAGD33_15805 [Actinomycetota bacterium]
MTPRPHTRPSPLSTLPTLTAAVAATLALTACGSEDTSDAALDTAVPTSADSTDVANSSVVRVAATDYAFGGLPDRIDAGTSIELVNASDVEAHELVAIRLPEDEERTVEELVRLPPDELGAFFPFVETVIVAPPGAPGFVAEGDGSLTVPGRYALLCMIPVGADPDAYLAAAAEAEGGPPDVDGGPPHIAEGMFAEIVVE